MSFQRKFLFLVFLAGIWKKLLPFLKSVRDHTFMTSTKIVQFLQNPPPPPSPSLIFLSARIGPNCAIRHRPWTSKLRLPATTTHPYPLWYSCSISIIFSRRLYHIPCPCNSELFITKNQFKLNSIFCSKTQASTPHLEC